MISQFRLFSCYSEIISHIWHCGIVSWLIGIESKFDYLPSKSLPINDKKILKNCENRMEILVENRNQWGISFFKFMSPSAVCSSITGEFVLNRCIWAGNNLADGFENKEQCVCVRACVRVRACVCVSVLKAAGRVDYSLHTLYKNCCFGSDDTWCVLHRDRRRKSNQGCDLRSLVLIIQSKMICAQNLWSWEE